jgi:hypothetical protein
MSVYLLAPILAVMAAFASFGVGAFTAVFTDNRLAHLLAGVIAMLVCTITTTWILAKVV